MRKIIFWTGLIILVLILFNLEIKAQEKSVSKTNIKKELKMKVENIHWLGHDAFRIEDQGKQIQTFLFEKTYLI